MPGATHDFAIRRYQCRHIFTDGHRCGSPCLRGGDFCYYHHSTRRPRPVGPAHDPYLYPPNETAFTLPLPEDHSSVQQAIGTVMHQLAINALDPRRAGLLLYALQIASGNLASAPRHRPDDIVEDVTLDPERGTLAPVAEVPADREYRSLLSAFEGNDEEDESDEEDEDIDEEEDGHDEI